ncbi:PLC-like phosphodiesterase [Ceratobasidium sp. AG-I]|nr:PLC-like phosphodiesterase [Ceratobasidium sp. AG-I]
MSFDPNKYASYKAQDANTLTAMRNDLQVYYPHDHILILHQTNRLHFYSVDRINSYHVETDDPVLFFSGTYGYDIYVLREAVFKYDGRKGAGEFLCDVAPEGDNFYTLKRIDGSADQLKHYCPDKYYNLGFESALLSAFNDLTHDFADPVQIAIAYNQQYVGRMRFQWKQKTDNGIPQLGSFQVNGGLLGDYKMEVYAVWEGVLYDVDSDNVNPRFFRCGEDKVSITRTTEGKYFTFDRRDNKPSTITHWLPERYTASKRDDAIKLAGSDLQHDYPGYNIVIYHGSQESIQTSGNLINKSLTLTTNFEWGMGGNWDCDVRLFQGLGSIQLSADSFENLHVFSGGYTRVDRLLTFRPRAASPFVEAEWMGGLSDKLLLSQLTIPGTHQSHSIFDTFAYGANAWAACQSASHDVTWQLNAGVRFLDLRCRWDATANHLRMCHGNFDTSGTLNDVIQVLLDFVHHHRRETIIVSIRSENNTSTPTSNPFAQAVYDIINGSRADWYLGTSIPLLEHVRGRLVLFRRYSQANASYLTTAGRIDGLNAPNFPSPTADIIPQDVFNPARADGDLSKAYDDKWNEITKLFTSSSSAKGPYPLYLNFISGVLLPYENGAPVLSDIGNFLTGHNPYEFAVKMNSRLHGYLDQFDTQPKAINLGVVIVDYPDKCDNEAKWEPGLITRLIRTNFVDW